jgi:hypothetical protein
VNVTTLLEHATPEEAKTILRILQRANRQPAIVVTMGLGNRRYVVAQEDEVSFEKIPDGPFKPGHSDWRVNFGAQWLRGYGRVDEMYRSLSLDDVTKVARISRDRVWGTK